MPPARARLELTPDEIATRLGLMDRTLLWYTTVTGDTELQAQCS